ncbi:hypothetical protein [Tsuneonella aeria]|uniref:hypothetical protein n=1 Tax=Tsuneonella aeria TaxID=1837929 RepID=UPI001928C7BE|nr:hypothetical protein [Tsuneonella aeria]
MLRKLPIALSAAALAISPVAVQAAQAQRATAPVTEDSQLGGSLLWIVAAIALVVGIILIADDDDPASPRSPERFDHSRNGAAFGPVFASAPGHCALKAIFR